MKRNCSQRKLDFNYINQKPHFTLVLLIHPGTKLTIPQISLRITEISDIFSLDILVSIKNLPKLVIDFLSRLFPILLCLAIVVVNLSLITGAIIYLLDNNEYNGKIMIQRSFIILCAIYMIFNPYSPGSLTIVEPFDGFQSFTSFVTSYLLFIFAALSMVLFILNLGFYLISTSPISRLNAIYRLKRCGICLICVLLPLSFSFPNMPIWIM
ncbi:MAG: hypothetical protein ACW97X_10420 [Candidatus Hodarchaeales archaeon]